MIQMQFHSFSAYDVYCLYIKINLSLQILKIQQLKQKSSIISLLTDDKSLSLPMIQHKFNGCHKKDKIHKFWIIQFWDRFQNTPIKTLLTLTKTKASYNEFLTRGPKLFALENFYDFLSYFLGELERIEKNGKNLYSGKFVLFAACSRFIC